MAENLKTTRYIDGNAIPWVTDNTAWSLNITYDYRDLYRGFGDMKLGMSVRCVKD
jgi:hypothetical protein